ncbi:HD domain-containing phosphohydrolase [Azospirillum agricola]|uniref:HD domain-containing phosphohydrolase n=1 Tax=Azospirillum agricola TaxID=1720247 RepID=UPI000A0EFE00|nr:HD domain-containing phosphohydrolase [Azospirillum agricola]SMH47916.1 putative two-component system response regulator [Azospirillum lipoferum]
MKVLLVDDDATALLIASSVIRRIDAAEPVAVTSPMEALGWLQENTPDLILIDQVMPELDGLAMLERIREQRHLADVPVVMITAETSVALRVAALERGCTDFLTKPIIVPELLVRAQNLLRLRTGQRLLKDQAAMLRVQVDDATALLRQQAQELVGRLAHAAEFRDPETGGHLERMAAYAGLIADGLGFDADERRTLVQAAPMHDIGKIGIPDSILLKPGRLTEPEMLVMRQHPVIGHSILCNSTHGLISLAAEIAHAHHEKFDGSGYPRGLGGHAIPLAARIVAVADVFDALTSPRPYKPAWPLEDARAFLLANSGSHFDPSCVAVFVARWGAVVETFLASPELLARA